MSDDFGVASTGPVAELAERLTEAIADEPFSVADKEISLTACAGVATCAYGGADQVLGNAAARRWPRARESKGGWRQPGRDLRAAAAGGDQAPGRPGRQIR